MKNKGNFFLIKKNLEFAMEEAFCVILLHIRWESESAGFVKRLLSHICW